MCTRITAEKRFPWTVPFWRGYHRIHLRRLELFTSFLLFVFYSALRQWRRGACRSDYNTTSARLSVTKNSKEKWVPNQFDSTSHHLQKGATTSFRPSETIHNTRARLKRDAHSKNAQGARTTPKIERKG